ncbi:MAG: chlorosome envelope protein B [Chlorobiaceae bacterium]
MANGTNDVTGAVNSLLDTVGKLATQQVELVSASVKTIAGFIEPLGKTATDLVGNAFGAVNQILQSVSSAIAPKK